MEFLNSMNYSSLFTSLFGAFFGALSAYWFNRISENKKEKTTNLCSLKCLVQTLISHSNVLIDLKVNILSDVERKGPIFHIYNFAKYDTSRLDFSVIKEPELSMSILEYNERINSLKEIIKEYNNKVTEFSNLKNTDNKEQMLDIIHIQQLLLKAARLELDNCIFMNSRSIENATIYTANYYDIRQTLLPDYPKGHVDIIRTVPTIQWYKLKKRTFAEKYIPFCKTKGGV